MDASTDLARAWTLLTDRARRLDTFFSYYDGDHPSLYSSAKLASEFAKLNIRFSENWCATVVDILLDRLNIAGFTVGDAAQETMDAMWGAEALGIETDEANADVPICGESYVIVWPDESGQVRWYRNDPRRCCVFYESADPRRKRLAAKMWADSADDPLQLTLYYPDRFEHWVSRSKACEVSSPSALSLAEEDHNETGIVPVFHFRTSARNPQGEIARVLPVQQAINRLIDDMMAASEYSAFRQRWMIANADPADMRAAPNTTVVIPPAEQGEQPVAVGQFEASDLKNFGDEIDRLAGHAASLTRTPRSAFFDQGAGISGDALIAMEAQLSKKAARYQERLAATWSEATSFALALAGYDVPRQQVTVVWDEVRTVQPLAEADALSRMVTAGLPLVTALRRQNWTESEIEQMQADRAAEAATRPGLLSAPFLDAARAASFAPPSEVT